MKEELSIQEMESYHPGEAITLTAVMAVVIIAVIAVVAYRLFRGSQGSVKVPGGYQFEWK